MSQTKWNSFVETVTSTAIGFAISFMLNIVVVPVCFHTHPSPAANAASVVIFTVASLIRGWCVRRWFNRVNVGDNVVRWVQNIWTAIRPSAPEMDP